MFDSFLVSPLMDVLYVFQKSGSERQIVNLGSGFDTLYWRLKDSNKNVTNFVEMDFPSVTAKKCYLIKRNKVLLDKIHVEGSEPFI